MHLNFSSNCLTYLIHKCNTHSIGIMWDRVCERILLPIFLQYVCLRSGGKSLGIPARCRDENVLPGGFAEAKARMLSAALC